MDLNESPLPLTISNARPISPSPVRETAVATPATVEEGTSGRKRRGGRPTVFERDARGRFTSQATIEKKRLLMNSKGDDPENFEGGDFKTHSFIVNEGENIISRIMYFTRNRSRGITILAANGQVANVKIQKLDSSEVLTFKETCDIISLNCSMTVFESRGMKVKTGGWVITIGGAGGAIFGGALACRRLIAASPVRVVIGSFWPLVSYPTQERTDESKALVVAPTLPNSLASSSTGQVIQPDMIGPSQSQRRNDDSQAEVVQPIIPTTIASLLSGPAEQPEIPGTIPFLSLGWYSS